MKRFLTLFISCCFLLSAVKVPAYSYGSQNYEDFSAEKSKYRILYGILLVVGGGFLAYDGFRSIKVDISRPSTNITLQSEWDNTALPDAVSLQAKGSVVNTGNVTLNNVTFEVRFQSVNPNYYYPDQGTLGNVSGYVANFTSSGGTILNTLQTNNSADWNVNQPLVPRQSNDPNGTAASQPGGGWYPSPSTDPNKYYAEVVNLKYTYDHKYETKMNNPYEGIAGVLLFSAGAYLLIDYIVSLNKFEVYMKKHSMDIYVQNAPDEFQLIFTKKI